MLKYIDSIRAMNISNINMIGLVAGPGAGSKFLHTLLDTTDGLYTIPGYCLMYFYPHYIEAKRASRTNKDLVYAILNRMPPLYDTRIMPGSESLNALGESGDQFLCTSIDNFASTLLKQINAKTRRIANSQELLISIHETHYKLFGNKARPEDGKMPTTLLYHIHCDLYLEYLKKDFPDCRIIATSRRPSINIDRRTNSSILEADKVKLNFKDYHILKPLVLSKMSYFHLNLFRIHKKYSGSIYYADYDKLLNNEAKLINDLRQWIGLEPLDPSNIKPTYAGLPHKLSFYEKHRSKSINQIRAENKKASKKANFTLLDKVYARFTDSIDKKSIPFWNYLMEIIQLTSFEKEIIIECYSIQRIFNFYKSINVKDSGSYNMKHAYYCFKWSTPKRYIILSAKLQNLLSSRNYLKKTTGSVLNIAFYGAAYPISMAMLPIFLIKKRINMVKLFMLSRN